MPINTYIPPKPAKPTIAIGQIWLSDHGYLEVTEVGRIVSYAGQHVEYDLFDRDNRYLRDSQCPLDDFIAMLASSRMWLRGSK